jgi:putative transposase
VISDTHKELKAAAAKVLAATWQHCKEHFLQNTLAHAGKGQRQIVLAAIRTAFAQDSFETATGQWRAVADRLRGKFPKLADLMDGAEADVLAYMAFPKAHRRRRHLPEEASITLLLGALLLEQNDEWQLQRRYMSLEALRALSDNQSARLSAVVS